MQINTNKIQIKLIRNTRKIKYFLWYPPQKKFYVIKNNSKYKKHVMPKKSNHVPPHMELILN